MILSASTVGASWLLLPSVKCRCALWEPVLELPARWVQPFPEHLIPVTAVRLSRRGVGAANDTVPGCFGSMKPVRSSVGGPAHSAVGVFVSTSSAR